MTFRIDSAYYQLELLKALRAERARFTVSVPRTDAMWKALERILESAFKDAIDMEGAQVAETTYQPSGWKAEPLRLIICRVPFSAQQIAKLKGSRRLKTIHPEQLQLALDGQLASVYGYSFMCAARRPVVSPAQLGVTRREVTGSNGSIRIRKVNGTIACQESGGQSQVSGLKCRGTRVIWRKLQCLKPNLQKTQCNVRRKDACYRRHALRRHR